MRNLTSKISSFYTSSAFTHSRLFPPEKPLFLYRFLIMVWTFVTEMECVNLAVGTFLKLYLRLILDMIDLNFS